MGSALATAPMLGRYRILGHLAAGGMAEILLASLDGPAGFQKLVVIKRVLPHLASRKEFRDMFLDEARIVAALRHPNIVQVTELSREGTDLFLAMEYLEGESLQRLVRRLDSRGERLPPVVAAHIVACACAGLHAAHDHAGPDGSPRQLVHRDVSPQNLFVTYDGAVKVIDFGVAKAADRYTHTTTGQIKGKFGYMSPEQCLAHDVDRRTDVFALGVVLWESSTGRRLFKRDNEMLVLKAICEDPIAKPSDVFPDYPPSLERIVMRALAREREDRYATAAEMRRDLLAFTREMAPAETLEDVLVALMATQFPDRIAQKRDFARLVSAGESPGPTEWLDASTGNIPIEVQSESGLRASSAATPPATRPDRTGWVAASIALGALVLALGLWAGSSWRTTASTPIESEPRAELAAAPASSSEAPPAALPPITVEPVAPPTVTAPAAPAQVMIDLDSVPSGADVLVAGELRGTTPMTLPLPAGTVPIDVVLSRRGFRPTTESITPDINQRLRVALVRGRSGAARPPSDPAFERFD